MHHHDGVLYTATKNEKGLERSQVMLSEKLQDAEQCVWYATICIKKVVKENLQVFDCMYIKYQDAQETAFVRPTGWWEVRGGRETFIFFYFILLFVFFEFRTILKKKSNHLENNPPLPMAQSLWCCPEQGLTLAWT